MQFSPATDALPTSEPIAVRTLTAGDLRAALSEGYADFSEKRGDILFAGLLYPVIGLVTAIVTLGSPLLPLLFPLAAGLSLLGPLVSTGFYELARRREAGLDSRWNHFLDVRKRPSFDGILGLGVLLIVLFFVWIACAGLIYTAFFGPETPPSLGGFLAQIFGTAEGWAMIVVGNLVGLGFAILVLAISAISLPMLVDRDIDMGTAIATSLRVFKNNRGVMLRWGAMVAGLLLLGSIPFFLGLAFVLPWLGYATWHLYTKAVERAR